MSIIVDPKAIIQKIAPEHKIKKLLKGNLTVKKAALNFVDAADFVDRKKVTDVALKVANAYQEREAAAAVKAGFDKAAGEELAAELVDDPRLLIQRVQNELIFQLHDAVKTQYGGQRARWLPSDADEPRPEHQLNYGKEYIIGEGIDGVEPGDEYGCQCGVEILTDETELKLE